jgi:hypothetical protein
VLAQRYIEGRREPSNHIATGGGAPDLQKTQMALRDARPAGKLELRPSSAVTPPAQAGGKLGFGSHDYLSGSCINDLRRIFALAGIGRKYSGAAQVGCF